MFAMEKTFWDAPAIRIKKISSCPFVNESVITNFWVWRYSSVARCDADWIRNWL